MAKLKSLLFLMVCILASAAVQAQSTNQFKLTIAPPNNTVMITETTNLLTVFIANLSATNTVVEQGDTNTVTNTVISKIFDGVTVTASSALTKSVTLADSGSAPDVKSKDSIYSGNFIAPTTKVALNLTVTFTVKGNDVTATNDAGDILPIPVTSTTRVVYKIYPRPLNDKFTNAFKIEPEGGIFTTYDAFIPGNSDLLTNNYAATEAGEPVHGGGTADDASVWWKWSSPVATNVLIDLAGSSFNPVMSVYGGNAVNSLAPVVSATSGSKKASVSFSAEAGKTYRIAIASPDTNITSQGSIRLRLAPGATPDTNGPLTQISAPADGSLFTTNLVLFSGTAAEPSGPQSGLNKVYLKVNDTAAVLAGTNANWSKTLTLPAGTNTVQAYAVDYVGNIGPSASISVIFMNPTNDFFGNSILLTGTSGRITAINGRATKEPGEPNHAGNDGGHSIWYHFRAPTDGVLSLTTSNSDFDTLLGVYTGDGVSNLTEVASNDDAYQASGFSSLQASLTSNVVYHIAIDGYGGASGNIAMQYSFVTQAPLPFYSLTVVIPEGGTVTPPSGYYLTNATLKLEATALPNYVFSRWEGDLNATNNPAEVTLSRAKTIVARFRYLNYTEDFETGGFNPRLDWANSTNSPWVVQSAQAEGQFAARSGAISDSQQSHMRLRAKNLAGQASFDLKVSSEYPYDLLAFYLNGQILKQWSGEVGWTTYFFEVPAGTNAFEWAYIKDATFSDGLDAAFIDNISLPQGSLAATIAVTRQTDNTVEIQVQGRMDASYRVQASANLSDWTTIASGQAVEGRFAVIDHDAARYPTRYYRAITP